MLTRRQMLGALLALPVVRPVAAQPEATPVAVSDAFTVTWWNIDDADLDSPVFRGNVLNMSDEMLDAPVIGITAYDADGNIVGSSYAVPEPPILEPGERAFLHGDAPEDLPEDAVLEFFHCKAPDGLETYVARNANLDLTLALEDEEREPDRFQATVTVQNNGPVPVEDISVVVLFVNQDGRIVGRLTERLDRDIPAGKFMRWKVNHGFGSYHQVHPFTDLLDPDYEVTYWVGYTPGSRSIYC